MDKIQTVVKMRKRQSKPESRISNDFFIANMLHLVDFEEEVLLLDFKLSWFQKQFSEPYAIELLVGVFWNRWKIRLHNTD